MSDQNRAIFLDRDGVLNQALVRGGKPFAPRTLNEFEILPEAPDALVALKKAGFLLIIATNQPDLGRGEMAAEELERMHQALRLAMPIDLIKVCPHSDKDDCGCRKPKAGMLTDAAAELGLDLSRSYMVGDRWRDVDCGVAAGVTSVFIDRGYEEKRPTAQAYTATDIADAATWIGLDFNRRSSQHFT